MANEKAGKFREAVTKTTAAIGVKTSVLLETAKAKTQIGTLKNEIDSLISEIGGKTYSMWEGESFDVSLIQDMCLLVREKNKEIELLNQEIARLESQEVKVFGAKEAARAYEGAVGGCACPNCGTMFEAAVKFCKKCGTKISAE